MSARRLKDAVLERYLAEALAAPARAEVEAVLAASEPDRRRVEELRADSAAFLTSHPPGRFAAQVANKRRSKVFWALSLVPAAVLAASVAVFVGGQVEPPWSAKGGVALAVHVRRGQGSAKLKPGESVPRGAALRFEISAPKAGFVALISKDAQGRVTQYHPFEGREAAPYEPRQPLLETAIQLEDVAGAEELYALWSAKPFETGWAVQALKEGAPVEREGVQVARATLKVE